MLLVMQIVYIWKLKYYKKVAIIGMLKILGGILCVQKNLKEDFLFY